MSTSLMMGLSLNSAALGTGGGVVPSGNVVNIASRVDWPINKLTILAGSVGVATKVAFWNGRKAMKNIRLLYANTYLLATTTSAGAEQTDLSTLGVAATLQKDGEATYHPATFGGVGGKVSIAAGAFALSDILPGVEIAANGKFFVHTARWGAAGEFVPNSNYYMLAGRGEGYGSTTVESQVYEYIAGTRAYTGNTGFNGLGPVGIMGEAVDGSQTECVIMFHDSIGFGNQEAQSDGDAKGNRGFLGRGFGDQGYYCWKTGRSGATILGTRKASAPLRFQLLRDYATHAIYQLGENSLAVASVNTRYEEAIDEILADKPGIEIIATTLGPKASSTDSWATAVNQSVAAGDISYAVDTANALRSNLRLKMQSMIPAKIKSFIPFWENIRSPSNPDKWDSVAETAASQLAFDAIHPLQAGHDRGKAGTIARITSGDFDV